MGLHRHVRRDRSRRGHPVPGALPRRDDVHHQRCVFPDHDEREQHGVHTDDHDLGRCDLHSHSPALHLMDLLDVPQADRRTPHPGDQPGYPGGQRRHFALMRPFDPRLLTHVPATRRPVLALGAIGVGQGLATIALAFALSNLVVSVVEGREVLAPGAWLVGLFTVRAVLAVASELVGTWAGMRVSTVLRERLIGAWLERDADSRPEAGGAQTLAAQGMTSIEPYVARFLPALVSAAFLP